MSDEHGFPDNLFGVFGFKRVMKDCFSCNFRDRLIDQVGDKMSTRCNKYGEDIEIGGAGLTHWFIRLPECIEDEEQSG